MNMGHMDEVGRCFIQFIIHGKGNFVYKYQSRGESLCLIIFSRLTDPRSTLLEKSAT